MTTQPPRAGASLAEDTAEIAGDYLGQAIESGRDINVGLSIGFALLAIREQLAELTEVVRALPNANRGR